jgi:hypothetical protein
MHEHEYRGEPEFSNDSSFSKIISNRPVRELTRIIDHIRWSNEIKYYDTPHEV